MSDINTTSTFNQTTALELPQVQLQSMSPTITAHGDPLSAAVSFGSARQAQSLNDAVTVHDEISQLKKMLVDYQKVVVTTSNGKSPASVRRQQADLKSTRSELEAIKVHCILQSQG